MKMEPTPARFRVTPTATWLSHGGVAISGMRYAPPDRAAAWGQHGCPLLPRQVRERHRGESLPPQLSKALGASLTIDQLNSEVLLLSGQTQLSEADKGSLRNFLYFTPFPADQVAIPAGVPLSWLESLPLTGRTRTAVRKAFQKAGRDNFLDDAILAHDFLALRSVGMMTLAELACVVESAELELVGGAATSTLEDETSLQGLIGFAELVHAAALRVVEAMPSFHGNVYEFARWAMAETSAETFQGAVSEIVKNPEASDTWEAVAHTKLSDLALQPPHPYETLDAWLQGVDPRRKKVFLARVSALPASRLTLQELADKFGVTRERIRQVETLIKRDLPLFLATEAAITVQWRAATLRRSIGVAVQQACVERYLKAPSECHDHRRVLLELAGPYDSDNGWYVLRSAQESDPTSAIMDRVDEAGRIDRDFANSQLASWGLDVSLHEAWLTRDGSVRLFNGQLVRWGASIPDRLVFALSDLGRPATIDEMIRHVGETRARISAVNALGTDPRVVKTSQSNWGLASWGLPEYSGVADTMRSLLQELGGSLYIAELARRLNKSFRVVESTTLAYCSAPMFIVEGETVRLRTPDDEPFQCDASLIDRTPGVFRLGPRRLGRLFIVDANVLRGSGITLTHAGGAILAVETNAHLAFSNQIGDRIDVTFPETAMAGPSIGSVRRIVERMSARVGDYLTLVLDRSDMSLSAHLTELKTMLPSWEIVGRLTGLASPVSLSTLAEALGCETGEVRSFLRARGDDVILDYLPQQETSSSLDEALFELESQFENVQGGST